MCGVGVGWGATNLDLVDGGWESERKGRSQGKVGIVARRAFGVGGREMWFGFVAGRFGPRDKYGTFGNENHGLFAAF
uniref:Uncharacterized protein n=1 Tax=Leersia perrieri TaxID=77586 RepID=A0A0D9X9G4_9ORYZ